ncbi:MAG: MFS transporter [Coriobacteriales bacterium]|jgi:Na+/melibiose symporter-like transporter|nr:MFS transporter [Coriobacteriales bacterium]
MPHAQPDLVAGQQEASTAAQREKTTVPQSNGGNSPYHRARTWQIGCFALNNTAVNLYFMMIVYINIWAGNVVGIAVIVVTTILLAMSVLDTITDPIVGWFIDRTNGRLGKFRPFMTVGNLLMIAGITAMFFSYNAGQGTVLAILLFVVCYLIYIVGYTCQFCVTRAAQSVLTNDPKQRPLFAGFDMVLNIILYVGMSMVVSNYLEPKHGGFTVEMFGEFFFITAAAAAVCTVLAVLGIWSKDRPQYFGLSTQTPHIPLRDYWDVIIHNRGVTSLMIAAGIDKLCSNIATNNATVGIIIFGIICGDYALMGQMNMFVFLPSLILSLLCIWFARRMGQKSAFLLGTYGALIATVALFLLFVLGDPASLSFSTWSLFTILLLVFTAVRGGFMSINNSILVPMVADISDSEVARSGRYVPGTIGAVFSFVDKLFTQLNNVVVGLLMVAIGFSHAYPTPDTPLTPELFWVGMICLCGLPALAWIVNIICMRFYPLDKQRMEEVQSEIAERKKA